jgi:hypothetical protein
VPQVIPFTNIFNWLKVMSLTSHTSSELKSLDYNAIIIKIMNCFPTKFNGDISFELPNVWHLLGHFRQLQGMDRKYDGHVWCELQTNYIKNVFRLCRNPSLGLVTKVRACKGAGQEGSPGVTSHVPRSVGECEGMNPHTPKWAPILGIKVHLESNCRGQNPLD